MARFVAGLCLCLAACLDARAVECGDRICAADSVCVSPGVCARPDQVAVCRDLDEGAACEVAGVPGACRVGVCTPFACGDGRAEGSEACDGDDLRGATCSAFGYYYPDGLACDAQCRLDRAGCTGECNDGVLDPDEACDGALLGGQTCRDVGFYRDDPGLACSSASCTFDVTGCSGRCGDGVLDSVEYCEGNLPPGDSCLTFGYDAGDLACNACGAGFDGCRQLRWRVLASGTERDLHDGWSDGDRAMVLVGDEVALHFDGVQANEYRFDGTQVTAVWGSAADDVYAGFTSLLGSATVQRYDGVSWQPTDFDPVVGVVTDLWGSGDQVFASLSIGAIARRTERGWVTSYLTSAPLVRVTGSGPADVYAASAQELFRFDGTNWSAVGGAPPDDILDLWMDGTTVYAALEKAPPARLEGSEWVQLAGRDLMSGVASAPRHIVGAPTDGSQARSLAHFDGVRWSEGLLPIDAAGLRMFSAGRKVRAVGLGGVLLEYDGAVWGADVTPRDDVLMADVSTAPDGTELAVGADGAVWLLGETSWVEVSSPTSADLRAALAVAATELYLAGRGGAFFRSTLAGWAPVDQSGLPGPINYTDLVWTGGVVYATGNAGGRGRIVRVQDGVAELVYEASDRLNAIAVAGPDLIAVGDGGIGVRGTGTVWTGFETGAGRLVAACAAEADAIWAVAEGGLLLRLDGGGGSTSYDLVSLELAACISFAPDDAFAFGRQSWHWNGESWTPMRDPNPKIPVVAVSGAPGGFTALASGLPTEPFVPLAACHHLERSMF